VHSLVKMGAPLESAGSDGEWPLLLAAEHGHVAVCTALIDAGSRVNSKHREDGNTPIHYAAAGAHDGLCTLLIDRGANLKARAVDGSTALHMAAIRGHGSTCSLLIKHGADVLAKATDGVLAGCNALEAAEMYEQEEIVSELREALESAKQERRDTRRRSSVHMIEANIKLAHGAEQLRALAANSSRGTSSTDDLENISRTIFGGRVPPAFASFSRRLSSANSLGNSPCESEGRAASARATSARRMSVDSISTASQSHRESARSDCAAGRQPSSPGLGILMNRPESLVNTRRRKSCTL
jgi:ankyrin repeat protein